MSRKVHLVGVLVLVLLGAIVSGCIGGDQTTTQTTTTEEVTITWLSTQLNPPRGESFCTRAIT